MLLRGRSRRSESQRPRAPAFGRIPRRFWSDKGGPEGTLVAFAIIRTALGVDTESDSVLGESEAIVREAAGAETCIVGSQGSEGRRQLKMLSAFCSVGAQHPTSCPSSARPAQPAWSAPGTFDPVGDAGKPRPHQMSSKGQARFCSPSSGFAPRLPLLPVPNSWVDCPWTSVQGSERV